MFRWLKDRATDLFGRAGGWASARARHLRLEPSCIACGRDQELEVHHVTPVHAAPDRELDPKNLATLCRDCHLSLGHAYDWKAWRPGVRELAAAIKSAEVRRSNKVP